MIATVIFTPEQTNGTNHADYTQVMVDVDAKIVSATRVWRKANGWLIMEVGERVMAGEPELLIGSPLVWRVPIH